MTVLLLMAAMGAWAQTNNGWDGDLSKLTEEDPEGYATATDGMTITGTLSANVKVCIADGASVTLKDATINGTNMDYYSWAGITCLGDVTISLSGTNTVKGFDGDYPGIYIVQGKTLTINGDGTLNASTNGYGSAIGGGQDMNVGNIVIEDGIIIAEGGVHSAGIGVGCSGSCGNITITGGNVTASAGMYGAGIGSCYKSSCGNITISGGTVKASGGEYGGAGIGSGAIGSCGDITITDGVTKVTAINGGGDSNSIGAGEFGDCDTVTICGKTGAISESPYELEPKTVDGINKVVSSPQSTGSIYYDLNGSRVVKMQKGIYIVKGKKVRTL